MQKLKLLIQLSNVTYTLVWDALRKRGKDAVEAFEIHWTQWQVDRFQLPSATDSPVVGPAVKDIWASSNSFSFQYDTDTGTRASSSDAIFILFLKELMKVKSCNRDGCCDVQFVRATVAAMSASSYFFLSIAVFFLNLCSSMFWITFLDLVKCLCRPWSLYRQ